MHRQEVDEALQLWEKIQDILQKEPDSYYSAITVEMYRIPCEILRGREDEAQRVSKQLLEKLEGAEFFEEIKDNLVILAGILSLMPDEELLGNLIRIIDEKHVEDHYNIFLDLYPFKSRLLLKKGQISEYTEYTRRYFEIYEKYQQENREALINVMEDRKSTRLNSSHRL